MLAEVISKYLEENRRLVIPKLGAFLVKEPGHLLIFSQLLTKDDGVLQALLVESGVSEIKASGMVQRLIFDVRFLQENGGELLLEGLGRFYVGNGGGLKFEQQQVVADNSEDDSASAQEDAAAEVSVEQIAAQDDLEASEVQEVELPLEQIAAESDEYKPIAAEKLSVPSTHSAYEPDPDLEGLNYNSGRASRRSSSRGSNNRRGVDLWLIIGVAAVLLALGAILYGFVSNANTGDFYESRTEQSW